MDVNDLRIAVTVVSLFTFLGVVGWVGLARNRWRFDEASLLPFAEDAQDGSS